MKLTASRSRKIAFLLVLFALAACGGSGDSYEPGPAPITALAYLLNECSESPGNWFVGQQKLVVRRGDADPVTVAEFPPYHHSPIGVCKLRGRNQGGLGFVNQNAVHRLGMSPDGSFLVFEVTDDFSLTQKVPPEQEGIFVVRTDGSGLRRIGDASRSVSFLCGSGTPLITCQFDLRFGFDGVSRIVFVDIGPGPEGAAEQIFTMDLETGARDQLTRLPPAIDVPSGTLPARRPGFLDAKTVVFQARANPLIAGEESNPQGERRVFTVKTDDPDSLKVVPSFAEPGNTKKIIEAFQITGLDAVVRMMPVQGTPVNGCGQNGCFINEVFVIGSDHVLQLTNFQRSDTGVPTMSGDRKQIYFYASADPLGTNPFNNCQLFSIDRTGAGLRQLTHFDEGKVSRRGCKGAGFPGPGCMIQMGTLGPDPVTGSILFASSCDPFGTNPNGSEVFAVRPDGTGLRQLTHTRGMVTTPDGTVTVELPGPSASPLLAPR